jgi:CubicO group peptidase (beta-lactamase class C family)
MIAQYLLTAAIAIGGGILVAAQPASSPGKTRVDVAGDVVKGRADAFFKALASGNAETFEAMAREHFQPELLARRTAADRKQMVERIQTDFGQMTLGSTEVAPDSVVTLNVRGATGLQGTIALTLEAEPTRRIARIAIDIGDGGPREGAPPPPDVRGSMSAPELTRELDAYLSPLVAADRFSGVMLVAKAGVPIYEKAWGEADRERHTPNALDTRFSIGSINKIFTRTAIAQLVAQGKLALTDSLGALLPDYPNAEAKSATVDQLLNHQGGIADFFGPAFDQAPKSEFRSNADYYRLVSSLPQQFAPGARRQYCNGCYIVLGAIVEKVSGVRYEDYIASNVYRPAGMATAGATGEGAAVGYTRRGSAPGGPLATNASMHGVSGSAAGGGFATAKDLLAFDEALRAGKLADTTRTAWLLQVSEVTPGRSDGGLGVAGGAPGLNAILESSRDWTVIVMANLDPPAAQQLGTAIHRQLSRH